MMHASPAAFATRTSISMRTCVALALTACLAAPLAAQGGAGRIEGRITDSLRGAPLAGARVSVTRLGVDRETTHVAMTDAKGHFALERLDAGEYAVGFTTALLDSLEYGTPARRIVVRPEEVARAELAVPSGSTLRALACPGVRLAPGTGALMGVLVDAETDRPIAGAQVAAVWTELTFDRGLLEAMTLERSGGVFTDSAGEYRLCGVPTGSWLLVQVQHGDRFGTPVQVSVPEQTGLQVRHLSFSREGSRERAELDSAVRDTTRVLAPLAGTAAVAGIVRGSGGRPIASAQVRGGGAAPATRTDDNGWFTLAGLPSGTQEVEVRELGFPMQRFSVDLRRGRTVHRELQLDRVQTLEGIRTVASRTHYEIFERNRRTSLTGLFLTQEQIARRRVQNTSELLAGLSSFRVIGSGSNAVVVNTRGGCRPNVVVDFLPYQEINVIPPSLVAGIEAYPTTNGAPPEYTNLCGVIRIWVKR